MKPARDENGRWQPGTSGNPAGRPRGAKDKHRRRISWDKIWQKKLPYQQRRALAKRFGKYASGGPGRPRGSYKFARAFKLAMRGDEMGIAAVAKFLA